MAVFGLLHGAFEGAWCWELLVPELRALGHEGVAVDLPIDDVTADWDDHVDVALAAFGAPDTIVVAHSRSGRMVPRLLERSHFTDIVLLSAAVPGGLLPPPYASEARPVAGQLNRDSRALDSLGRTVLTPEVAALVFSDCTDEQIAWALANARPQHELPSPPDTQWREVHVSYIFGSDERAVAPEWIRAACRERLGIEPIEVPGGHSLFISRPRELAAQLSHIAAARSTRPLLPRIGRNK